MQSRIVCLTLVCLAGCGIEQKNLDQGSETSVETILEPEREPLFVEFTDTRVDIPDSFPPTSWEPVVPEPIKLTTRWDVPVLDIIPYADNTPDEPDVHTVHQAPVEHPVDVEPPPAYPNRAMWPVIGITRTATNNWQSPLNRTGGWRASDGYISYHTSSHSCVNGYHSGYDIRRRNAAAHLTVGSPVVAVLPGVVAGVIDGGHYGKAVVVRHTLPRPVDICRWPIVDNCRQEDIPEAERAAQECPPDMRYSEQCPRMWSSILSSYHHLDDIGLERGDQIEQGQLLGHIIQWCGCRDHLHFMMKADTQGVSGSQVLLLCYNTIPTFVADGHFDPIDFLSEWRAN